MSNVYVISPTRMLMLDRLEVCSVLMYKFIRFHKTYKGYAI